MWNFCFGEIPLKRIIQRAQIASFTRVTRIDIYNEIHETIALLR